MTTTIRKSQTPHVLHVLRAAFGAERALELFEENRQAESLAAYRTILEREFNRSDLQAEFTSFDGFFLAASRAIESWDGLRSFEPGKSKAAHS